MIRSKRLAAAILASTLPIAAAAEIETIQTDKSVPEAVDALTTAIEGAGATVFTTVDHGSGARTVDMDIGDSVLVIFGNPKVGTPAMADNRLAGLHLPLKVLVYEDANGRTHLAYVEPGDVLSELDGVEADADYIAKMEAALKKLATTAAE